MSERKRRGVPSVLPPVGVPTTIQAPSNLSDEVNTQSLTPNGPERWLFKVSVTVFEGFFIGTEEQGRELDEKLRADTRISSGVYLRKGMRQEKTDYTDIQQVLDDVELAIPKR